MPPGADTCENQNRPAATKSIPTISVGLNPSLVTSCEATPAETMISNASGRYARPVFSAL